MKDLPDLKDLTLRKVDIRLPGKEDSNGYLEKRIQMATWKRGFNASFVTCM